MKINLLFLTLLSFSLCNHENNWAILVAGSVDFWNYRHQADIFHSYQTLVRGGFNKDHIILFAFNDMVNDVGNPWRGEMYNAKNGQDVYKGVIIDYDRYDVKAENFLKVIKGDKKGMAEIGSGKVLESTSKDNVFIFFSGHGSDGIIEFPFEFLYRDSLMNALQYMHEKKMYHQLVFYMESCNSGSMFELLPDDLNIYATTAAKTGEYSMAYYCGLEAIVRGKYFDTCLGDEYSIKWLEDTDVQTNPESYTLQEQYETVKKLVTDSHVCEFGDFTMSRSATIKDFQYHETNETTKFKKFSTKDNRIPSKNVKLEYLKNKAQRTKSLAYHRLYEQEIELISRSKTIFDLFKTELNLPERRKSKNIDFDCLKLSVEIYKDLCGLNERDLEFIHVFTIACSIKTSLLRIYTTLKYICSSI